MKLLDQNHKIPPAPVRNQWDKLIFSSETFWTSKGEGISVGSQEASYFHYSEEDDRNKE